MWVWRLRRLNWARNCISTNWDGFKCTLRARTHDLTIARRESPLLNICNSWLILLQLFTSRIRSSILWWQFLSKRFSPRLLFWGLWTWFPGCCLRSCIINSEGAEQLKRHVIRDWITTLKVGVPALLYVIQNQLLFVSLANLDPATYQVTCFYQSIYYTVLCN